MPEYRSGSWSSYLKVPPNVGVQKSTVVSWVTGKVLETGTRHSPRLLRSCLGPSGPLHLSEFCITIKKKYCFRRKKKRKGFKPSQ